MKKSFIPKSLRPNIVGSKYSVSIGKQLLLKNEVNIEKILDLQERSRIIKKLFREEDLLTNIDSELVENLRSCLITPPN